MNSWAFSLAVNGIDLFEDEHLQQLHNEFADASARQQGGVQYVDFDRDAETYGQALFSALAGLTRAFPGLHIRKVLRDLVSLREIADRVGMTYEAVRLLR